MSKGVVARIALSRVGDACTGYPDEVLVRFDEGLVRSVSAAQLSLEAMDTNLLEVSISLSGDMTLLEDGEVWEPEHNNNDGDFEPSSLWLNVQRDHLYVEVWEEHCDDECTAGSGRRTWRASRRRCRLSGRRRLSA